MMKKIILESIDALYGLIRFAVLCPMGRHRMRTTFIESRQRCIDCGKLMLHSSDMREF